MNLPMPNKTLKFDNIALAVHPLNEEAYTLAEEISQTLKDDGKEVLLGKMDDISFREMVSSGKLDLLIALGGDGTMLRAGHIASVGRTPILGINLGSYGFLTETQRDGWNEALDRIFNGDFWLEKRMMLKNMLGGKGGAAAGGGTMPMPTIPTKPPLFTGGSLRFPNLRYGG